MRKRKKNKRLLWIIAVSMTLIAIASVCFLKKPPVKKTYVAEMTLEDNEKTADVTDGYANETSYSGSSYVPASLFEKPFKKTGDYIMNKDYINIMGAEEAGVLSERTAKGLEEIYNINYETIDEDTYKGTLDEYADSGICYINRSTNDSYEGVEEVSSMITDLAKDTKLIMEVKAYSDKSLVYYDNHSDIVRTKIIGAVYSCKDLSKLEDFLGIDNIEIGKPFSAIFDIYTGTDVVMNDCSSYVIREADRIK